MSKLIAFILAMLALSIGQAMSAPASTPTYDAAAVARLHAGIVDCPGCNLQGADLTNTCVKAKNLAGANFDGAKAVLMCMSFANFSNATFRGTDLSAANLAHADLDGADLTGAVMTITSLKGTDLTKTKGLTQKQLDAACGDADTKVPAGLTVHLCT
ncbi:MAG TPA: pentapeptide repeat-containing protein [Rhizomicrobium sp.]